MDLIFQDTKDASCTLEKCLFHLSRDRVGVANFLDTAQPAQCLECSPQQAGIPDTVQTHQLKN